MLSESWRNQRAVIARKRRLRQQVRQPMNHGEAAVTDAKWNREVTCEKLAAVAERELAAFTRVVRQQFGPEEARQASEDWLREFTVSDCFAQDAIPDFRQLTVAAANRLALRLREIHSRGQFVASVASRHRVTIPDSSAVSRATNKKRHNNPEGEPYVYKQRSSDYTT